MGKITLLALGLALALAGCGDQYDGDLNEVTGNACAQAAVLGTWEGAKDDDQLEFKINCVGTSTACGSTFRFPNVTEASWVAAVDVRTSNLAKGCMRLGINHCGYKVSGSSLALMCGDEKRTYYRVSGGGGMTGGPTVAEEGKTKPNP